MFEKINQNTILFGIAVGVLLPFVGVAILMMLNEGIADMKLLTANDTVFEGLSNKLLYIIAICLNMIPFRIFVRRRYDKAFRGISFPTIGYVFLWLYQFGFNLF